MIKNECCVSTLGAAPPLPRAMLRRYSEEEYEEKGGRHKRNQCLLVQANTLENPKLNKICEAT